MTETVSVRLDKTTLEDIAEFSKELKTDRSEVLRRALEAGIREMKRKKILELLRLGKISVGKAAELSDLTIYEVLELMQEQGIPVGYTMKELYADLKKFKVD